MPEDQVSLSQLPPTAEQVPTDLVPLPSEGKVYPAGSPLANAATVSIRSMTARDEDILTSRALLRSGKVVNAILRSCIVDKSVDVDRMLVGDRNAVLIGIRITGYGAAYPVKVECPNCAAEVKREIDLTQLPIKRFPADLKINPGVNEFEFLLPLSKRPVTFKLFTGAEERALLQVMEQGRKSGMADELVTTRLRMQITSIAGERDPQRIANQVMSMAARDSRELRRYIDGITPAVELKAGFKCDVCSYDGEVQVPLGTEFFWPEA